MKDTPNIHTDFSPLIIFDDSSLTVLELGFLRENVREDDMFLYEFTIVEQFTIQNNT